MYTGTMGIAELSPLDVNKEFDEYILNIDIV